MHESRFLKKKEEKLVHGFVAPSRHFPACVGWTSPVGIFFGV